MARKTKRITDPENETRADVTWRHAILLSFFAVLAIVSIFTVMIPELRDDGAEDEADAVGAAAAESAPEPPSASAHTP